MIRPRHLTPGDRIGIIAPSGPVREDGLRDGIAAVEARGYSVVVGDHVLGRLDDCDYLAGTDENRLADMHNLLRDETLAAVFAACGGYGVMRLFRKMDLAKLRAHPKLFVGYSDLTSLHLALAREAGIVTFHGPNLIQIPRLDTASSEMFWRLLEEPGPYGVLPTGAASITTLVPGAAEGEIAGGNLCLLAHACGSRFTPDFEQKIILIEDVGEAIYRADRFLTQLQNAGLLQQAAGFVIGTITNWRAQEKDPPYNTPESLWRRLLAPLGKPAIVGYPFGHEPNPLTLPLGVRARLDADSATLTLLESATK